MSQDDKKSTIDTVYEPEGYTVSPPDPDYDPLPDESDPGHVVPALKIKKLENYIGLPDPAYATTGSAAFDLVAAFKASEPITLATTGDRAAVRCGISVEIPPGYEGQVRPRSGLADKHGITVLNAPGTIDSDYRGEIKVILVNTSTRKFKIERGMRIAQLVIAPVVTMPMEFADELSETSRGAGGFGSTGTH